MRTFVIVVLSALLVAAASPVAWAEPSPSPSTRAKKVARTFGVEAECDGGNADREQRDIWIRFAYDDIDLDKFGGRDLEWRLSGPGGPVQTGKLAWVDEDNERYYDTTVDLQLAVGRYRMTLTLVDEARLLADGKFDVVHCIAPLTGCHAMTITNPPDNPAILFKYIPGYGDGELTEEAKGGRVIVQPGQTRTIPTFISWFLWDAYGPPTNSYPNAGNSDGNVDQHCGKTMTRGVVRCAVAGRGSVQARLSPPDRRAMRYRITDQFGEALPGNPGGPVGRDGTVRRELPEGQYLFRAYTTANRAAYDLANFNVEACVAAAQRCHAVRFSNPQEEPVTISYRRSGDTARSSVQVGSGESASVPIATGTLTWRTRDGDTGLFGLTEGWRATRGSGSVRIDPTCASVREDKLARTGGPSGWLLAGGGAVVVGLLLRRRPRR